MKNKPIQLRKTDTYKCSPEDREKFEKVFYRRTGNVASYAPAIKDYTDFISSLAWRFFLEGLETKEETIQSLRNQLQNCVNHLEREKHSYGEGRKGKERLSACIESANKCLYETLNRG